MNEKEAIKVLNIAIGKTQGVHIYQDILRKAIDTVLNLIEKQQAEIERLTTNNEILQGELDKIGVKTLKLEVGSSTDDIIAELEKKDKVIHLMAKDIKEADKFLDSMGYLGEYEGYTIEGIIEEYNQEIEKGE